MKKQTPITITIRGKSFLGLVDPEIGERTLKVQLPVEMYDEIYEYYNNFKNYKHTRPVAIGNGMMELTDPNSCCIAIDYGTNVKPNTFDFIVISGSEFYLFHDSLHGIYDKKPPNPTDKSNNTSFGVGHELEAERLFQAVEVAADHGVIIEEAMLRKVEDQFLCMTMGKTICFEKRMFNSWVQHDLAKERCF